MKIFDSNNSVWDQKVNFVDINNVGVGYDTAGQCCEWADWFISESEESEPRQSTEDFVDEDLEPYVFDPEYFEDLQGGNFDGGGMIRFKLVAESKPNLYLHIFNSHNGYYSHGFEVLKGEQVVKAGYL